MDIYQIDKMDIYQIDKEINYIGGFDNIFWELCKSKGWFYMIIDIKLINYNIYQMGIFSTIYACYINPKKMYNVGKFIMEKSHYLIQPLVQSYIIFNDLLDILHDYKSMVKAVCDTIELLVIFSPYYHTNLCDCKICHQSKNRVYGTSINKNGVNTIIAPLNPNTITEINKMLSIDDHGDAIIFVNELCRQKIIM
jgi:hypothetical protein